VSEALEIIQQSAVTRRKLPDPNRSYYRGSGGVIHGFDACALPPALAQQVTKGLLVPLTDHDRDQYLTGGLE
jgi:hypothetical protein